jgi:hypothetical protein
MKSEIRGLIAGDYYSNDGSLLLRIFKKDDGIAIEIADMDADIFYAAKVNDDKVKFEWGNITPNLKNPQGEKDGEN